MKTAASYVDITREEVEEWLNDVKQAKHIIKRWTRKAGTTGVYQLHLSDNVAVEVSTSVGERGQTMDIGRAAMHAKLVSLVTGRAINRKAMGAKHAKRTTNWRTTWVKYVQNYIDTYVGAISFYENVANPDPELGNKLVARIEAVPGWEKDHMLSSFHMQARTKGFLTDPQIKVLEAAETKQSHKPTPNAQVTIPEAPRTLTPEQEAFLERLRSLYKAAQARNDKWLMEFLGSVGQMIKHNKPLTDKQKEVLRGRLQQYRLGSMGKEAFTPEEFLTNLDMLYKAARTRGHRWLIKFIDTIKNLISANQPLTQTQKDVLKKNFKDYGIGAQRPKTLTPEQEGFLVRLRALYKAALSRKDRWLVSFLGTVEQLIKNRHPLSPKQKNVLRESLFRYKLGSYGNVRYARVSALAALRDLDAALNVYHKSLKGA